mmetsp:Transcript_29821/g.97595  ORF Transcript_29821/g.97595 Transcript_29821/m.97595 type:complete len:230 (-) Transcript_29821:450-1139(-)
MSAPGPREPLAVLVNLSSSGSLFLVDSGCSNVAAIAAGWREAASGSTSAAASVSAPAPATADPPTVRAADMRLRTTGTSHGQPSGTPSTGSPARSASRSEASARGIRRSDRIRYGRADPWATWHTSATTMRSESRESGSIRITSPPNSACGCSWPSQRNLGGTPHTTHDAALTSRVVNLHSTGDRMNSERVVMAGGLDMAGLVRTVTLYVACGFSGCAGVNVSVRELAS